MHITLQRLEITVSARQSPILATQAVLTFDGSDHGLEGWEVDAVLPQDETGGVACRNEPYRVRLWIAENERLEGRACLRRIETGGAAVYLHFAGVGPLTPADSN